MGTCVHVGLCMCFSIFLFYFVLFLYMPVCFSRRRERRYGLNQLGESEELRGDEIRETITRIYSKSRILGLELLHSTPGNLPMVLVSPNYRTSYYD